MNESADHTHASGAPGPLQARDEEVTGDPAAFLASAGRLKVKLAALRLPATPVQLGPDERAALAHACQSQFPRFAARIAEARAADVGAPFFHRVRVLRLDSLVPFPAQTAHAAWLSSGPVMLSKHPGALAAVCSDEPPDHVEDPELALLLALHAGTWTSASVHQELRINSVDDIPFRDTNAAARALAAEVRREFSPQIHPAKLATLADGLRITLWVASESRLRRRVSEVRGRQVRVTETIVADLPIPPGRMWGMVGGRLVPTG